MAGDWIKIRKTLFNDGRVRILSAKCPQSVQHCVGALVQLWSLADDCADENGVLLGYTKQVIDELVCTPGFCDALHEDWIDLSGEWVKLPDYQQHNGATAKRRAQDAQRKKFKRSGQKPYPQNVRKKSASGEDVLRTREEKRREEYITTKPPLLNSPPENENSVTPKPDKQFKKPNIYEIRKYILEINSEINPEQFLDFYTANGWTQGKGKPIKNWQACVRTWERNQNEKPHRGNGNGNSSRTDKPKFKTVGEQVDDELRDAYRNLNGHPKLDA